MPFFNKRGEWCSGIAGVGVYWQGGTIWGPGTAGGASWWTDDEVIAQFFDPPPARLRAYNVRTKVERDLHVAPISFVYGSTNGHWIIQTQTEVLDWAGRKNGRPPGERPSISGTGPMAPDGSYPVKIDWQSWGPYEIVRPNGTFYRLTGPEGGPIDYTRNGAAKVDAHQIEGYGEDRWTWVDNDGNPRAFNLPVPEPLMRPFWWFKYVFIEGQIWQLYQMGDGRTVLHQRGVPRGHVIHDGDAFNTNAWVNGRFVRVVSSTNQGEAAQFVFTREYPDVFQGMVDLLVAKPEEPPQPPGPPQPPKPEEPGGNVKLTKNFKGFWQDLWNEFRISEKQTEILNRLTGDAATHEITRLHARLCVTGMRRIVRHVDPSVGMEKHYNAVPGTDWFFNPDIMLIYEHGVPWSVDFIFGINGRWDQGGEVGWMVHENQDHDAHKRNWLDPLDAKFDGISFDDEEGGGGTVAKYRDGEADVRPVLEDVWREMRVSERSTELAKRHPSASAADLEQEFKAIQVPALVETAARCHHAKGMSDVGLSTKNGGNRWTLPDGQNIATDIITLKDQNGSGKFLIVDCITSVGSAESRPTWIVHGENKDPSRPWMQPPEPISGGGEVERHRYTPPRAGVGPCVMCGEAKENLAFHFEEEEPEEPIVEKHDFVPAKFNANTCSECGLAKTDPVHQKEPAGGGSADMTATNAILREMLAEQKVTNRKLDELRTGVIEAVREFGKTLPSLLGGLGGIFGGIGKKSDSKK